MSLVTDGTDCTVSQHVAVNSSIDRDRQLYKSSVTKVAVDKGLVTYYNGIYAVITIAIRQRSDYDASRVPASIRRDSTRAKNEHVNFSSYNRVVVVSQSNRNCDIGFT